MATETILWRRLDTAGHDACRLDPIENGWCLDGTAAFRHELGPACLSYTVVCDADWRTGEGTVHGWMGAQRINIRIKRSAEGQWMLNEKIVPHLDACADLDLSFTPATNLFQLRRIALQIGQGTEVPVAWLDVPVGTLEVLYQYYERHTEDMYWYEAPRFDYTAFLKVRPIGFIDQYPGLWKVEP